LTRIHPEGGGNPAALRLAVRGHKKPRWHPHAHYRLRAVYVSTLAWLAITRSRFVCLWASQIAGEVLADKDYVADEVPELSGEISERCLSRGRDLCPTYKIVVNVSLLQRTGSGLHTCSACFWDRELDACCSIRWESQSMYCIIAIFGVSV